MTRYWLPVFGEPKKDRGLRLLTNLRALNKCFSNDNFKMECWTDLQKVLEDTSLQYEMTLRLDLKLWFHHLEIHLASRRWIHFKLRTG
mmetsp:Transcript_79786/g.140798  ORF Transcript_79786/g.140798 Transcript_79786/m.140798 type:complete len:88 (-) Transcript_79786:2484-2747(-)